MISPATAVPLTPRVDFPEDIGLSDLWMLFDPDWVYSAYQQRYGLGFPVPEADSHSPGELLSRQSGCRQLCGRMGTGGILALAALRGMAGERKTCRSLPVSPRPAAARLGAGHRPWGRSEADQQVRTVGRGAKDAC